MSDLTHIDEHGHAKMVDTSEKAVTARRAVAFSARSHVRRDCGSDSRTTPRPKAIRWKLPASPGSSAAKRTAELIPLCHPLPLTHVDGARGVAGGPASIWKQKSALGHRPELRWKL